MWEKGGGEGGGERERRRGEGVGDRRGREVGGYSKCSYMHMHVFEHKGLPHSQRPSLSLVATTKCNT